ncbi:GNAT family N-acetyltransferase [Streptococcus cuniculi]|uniref:GNAT family N-acetyltransferase n=1 Tax=Streptococcus cuniculi TaxID=1432788 RepID=A0A4Y9JC61_9STRE|nr:GNAT family N-acetyltransferase [Streptococcus cuniculi]MBF0777491.1 GNAT family N-acetyltransferase [Streptococcus cuniculi]TFU98542.1 GNAT family N-acetyltransferase [Streptococcus cuniculi]
MIRPYQEGDVLACQHLLEELGYPSPVEEVNRWLTELLEHSDYSLLVYEEDGQVLGLIGYAKMYFFERKGAYLRILALVVDSQYRNQGIATALLNRVKQIGKETGCQALALNSGRGAERQTAHAFYEHYGFEKKSIGFTYQLEEK